MRRLPRRSERRRLAESWRRAGSCRRARQLGTALSSLGGSACAPSAVSSLNRNAILLLSGAGRRRDSSSGSRPSSVSIRRRRGLGRWRGQEPHTLRRRTVFRRAHSSVRTALPDARVDRAGALSRRALGENQRENGEESGEREKPDLDAVHGGAPFCLPTRRLTVADSSQ
jgi:hypothetical protein